MTRIANIVGSTRPGRKAESVARWVYDIACTRDDATFEVVDLADYALPHLDEPTPDHRLGQRAADLATCTAARLTRQLVRPTGGGSRKPGQMQRLYSSDSRLLLTESDHYYGQPVSAIPPRVAV